MTQPAFDSWQQAVVEWEPSQGNRRAAAGAGSGKTRSVVGLVTRLVSVVGVPPEAIICTTFTKNGAEEMKKRLRTALTADVAGRITLGTFHALGLQDLRSREAWRWPQDLCLDTDGGVRMPEGHLVNSTRLWRDALGFRKVPGTNTAGLRVKLSEYEVTVHDYTQAADRCASRNLFPGMTRREDQKSLDQILDLPSFEKAWKMVAGAKKVLKAWDFSDVLSAWRTDLKKSGRGYTGRALVEGTSEPHGVLPWDPKLGKIVIVDEGQDNSKVQIELARRLAGPHGRVMLVGDPRQAIFRFRGGDIDFFLEAQEHLEAQTLDLPVNYRSGASIVTLANELVVNEPWVVGEPSLAARDVLGSVSVMCDATPEDEALWIVQDIVQKHVKRLPDVAVLVRTNSMALRVMLMLAAYNVPCRALSTRAPIRDKSVEAYMAWMRVAAFPNTPMDPTAVAGIFAAPMNFVPAPIKQLVLAQVSSMGTLPSLQSAARGSQLAAHRASLEGMITTINSFPKEDGPAQLAHATHVVCGGSTAEKLKHDAGELGGTSDDDDARALINVLATIGKVVGISALYDIIPRLWRWDKNREAAVTIGTVHASKGLEWPVVYVAGLTSGVFPSAMSMSAQALDEEKRLLYVAITRARDTLVMTSSDTRWRAGRLINAGTSPLLEPLLPGLPGLPERAKATFLEVPGTSPDMGKGERVVRALAEGALVALETGSIAAGAIVAAGRFVLPTQRSENVDGQSGVPVPNLQGGPAAAI